MARPISAKKRGLAALLAGATAVSGAALLAPSTSSASSHREAPYIATDPEADNTDTYAFVSPDDPNSVTFIANWWPFSDAAGGPNFFPFGEDVAHDINIDNDGDAKPDITYRWEFKNDDRRGTVKNGGGVDGTFLYNNGPVTSLDDENLLFRQTYDLTVLREGAATGTVVLDDVPVAPSNVGVASMPDYVQLRKQAVAAGTREVPGVGRVQSYAGQADDPFFLDLRIFDLLYGADLSERGYDTLKEYNVNTIAYKVPTAAVVANGDKAKNPVIGVWSTTSRKKTRVFTAENTLDPNATTESGEYVQVSRLGNPLVNEAVVPAQLKDAFNRLDPENDAAVAGGALLKEVQDPELPRLIEGVYKIKNPNTLGAEGSPARTRNDLVGAFLTGFSKKTFRGESFGGAAKGVLDADLNSLDLNEAQPSGGVQPAEYLRLNTAVPPTPANRLNPLGPIAGDLAGFPNGRRLQDDVVDIAIQVVEGALIGQDPAVLKALSALDGVSSNDRPFLNEFPYIADPHAGSDPRSARAQVMFKQQFSSNNGRVTTKVTGITPAAPGGFVQLYRIDADGRAVGLGSMKLNGAGTESVTKTFPARRGEQLTLNYRVFTDRRSAAESNRGVPTTITVR